MSRFSGMLSAAVSPAAEPQAAPELDGADGSAQRLAQRGGGEECHALAEAGTTAVRFAAEDESRNLLRKRDLGNERPELAASGKNRAGGIRTHNQQIMSLLL